MRTRLLGVVVAGSLALSGVAGAVAAPPAAVAATPKCSFNNGALPIVMNVRPGNIIRIACTGLSPATPHLILQASLLIGIDPEAKALLSGGSGLSPALLTAALAALPKVNPESISTHLSDLNGNLTIDYEVPASQAPDPNASCPPSRIQFNSGLIGCALAMVDLVTQKPVGAGSGVLQYPGFPFLPPSPTLSLSAKKVVRGQTLSVKDAPGTTNFWWVSTLAALNNLLAGTNSTPRVTVGIGPKRRPVIAQSNVVAAPASYSNGVFHPAEAVGDVQDPVEPLRGQAGDGQRVPEDARDHPLKQRLRQGQDHRLIWSLRHISCPERARVSIPRSSYDPMRRVVAKRSRGADPGDDRAGRGWPSDHGASGRRLGATDP